MTGLKHKVKKHLTKVMTRRSTISKGISAEYVSYRAMLDQLYTSVKSLIEQVQVTSKVWTPVTTQQGETSTSLIPNGPSEAISKSDARKVHSALRPLKRILLKEGNADVSHRKLISILEGYLKMIENLRENYDHVETSYTEVKRYQKKVDKLGGKRETKMRKLQRNTHKLISAKSEHEEKLQKVVRRMKEVYHKHEAVFQCAHHAFWILQNKHSKIIGSTINNMRRKVVTGKPQIEGIEEGQDLPPNFSALIKCPPLPEKVSSDVVQLEEQITEASDPPVTEVAKPGPSPSDSAVLAAVTENLKKWEEVSTTNRIQECNDKFEDINAISCDTLQAYLDRDTKFSGNDVWNIIQWALVFLGSWFLVQFTQLVCPRRRCNNYYRESRD